MSNASGHILQVVRNQSLRHRERGWGLEPAEVKVQEEHPHQEAEDAEQLPKKVCDHELFLCVQKKAANSRSLRHPEKVW